MVLPIAVLVIIPIFLGIVYVTPFEQPEEPKPEVIEEKPDATILYMFLMGIWLIFLLRILLQLRRGTFRVTQRY